MVLSERFASGTKGKLRLWTCGAFMQRLWRLTTHLPLSVYPAAARPEAPWRAIVSSKHYLCSCCVSSTGLETVLNIYEGTKQSTLHLAVGPGCQPPLFSLVLPTRTLGFFIPKCGHDYNPASRDSLRATKLTHICHISHGKHTGHNSQIISMFSGLLICPKH